jgi:hypothetical protein
VTNGWGGGVIERAYNAVSRRRGLPPLNFVLNTVVGQHSTLPFGMPHPLAPTHPYTLSELWREVEASAKANHLTVVRVKLLHTAGWNAYIEVRTADPRHAFERGSIRLGDRSGLTTSLFVTDNPCGTPIDADTGAHAQSGAVGMGWSDPAWYPPGDGMGIGPAVPALLPSNPCF